jgi:ubiquinone biosynthesis protein
MYDNLLSNELHDRLNYTLEDCKVHSWNDTKQLYYNNYGRNINDDYELDTCTEDNDSKENIIGSGSIGQVYKLYNKKLDKFVAVKVRHPNIDNEIDEFVSIINILDVINKIFSKFFTIPYIRVINTFKLNIIQQKDFISEANNMIKYSNNFKNDTNIIIPYVYYYSADFIIMDYHKGIPINEISNKQLKYSVSYDINFIQLSSIMIYDLLHSDLHNGNWKVELLENNKYNIIIYDFGIVVSTKKIKYNQNLILSIMTSDHNTFINVLYDNYILKEHEKLSVKENLFNKLYIYIHNIDKTVAPCDKLRNIMKYAINNNIIQDNETINLLLSMIMSSSIQLFTANKMQKIINLKKNTIDKAIVFNLYIDILNRINRYKPLNNFFINYITNNKESDDFMNEWLQTNFGHNDKYILFDIIAKYIYK